MLFNGHKVLSLTPEELTIETEDGPAVLRGYDPTLIEYESVDEAREANREKLDEGGRERLKQLGARNLEEASIAAIGMSDELNRYEMSEARRAELEASLDSLQSIRKSWNDLIAANEAAQTHAELEEVAWS